MTHDGMNIMPLLLLGGVAVLVVNGGWEDLLRAIPNFSSAPVASAPVVSNPTTSPVTTAMVNNGGPVVTQTVTPAPALPQGVQTRTNMLYIPISGEIQAVNTGSSGNVRLVA